MIHLALQGKAWQCCICRSTLLCFCQEQLGPGLLLSFVIPLTFLYACFTEESSASWSSFQKQRYRSCLFSGVTDLLREMLKGWTEEGIYFSEPYLHDHLLSCPTDVAIGTEMT